MKRLLILLFITASLSCEKNDELINRENCSDCIVAGDSDNNLHTDIIPDTTLSLGGSMGRLIYEIDLDSDETYDYFIQVYFSQSPSHKSEAVSIYPHNNNMIGAFDSIPVVVNNDTVSYSYKYYGVSDGDTINNNLSFRNVEVDLSQSSYGVMVSSSSSIWDGKHYIPVCLKTEENDTYFGWIKVSNVSDDRITIESYALNIADENI